MEQAWKYRLYIHMIDDHFYQDLATLDAHGIVELKKDLGLNAIKASRLQTLIAALQVFNSI